MRYITAAIGLSSVALFCIALIVFGSLNGDFDYLEDYISKLGAEGQPYAVGWNLVGFFSVGILLTLFGWTYGHVLHDRFVGLLLSLFGVGFAVTATPTNIGDPASTLSKAHTVAICLAVAAWLFGLARMAHLASLGRSVYYSANTAAFFAVVPIAGHGLGWWSMPVTHRLVFLTIFAWVTYTSFRLLLDEDYVPHFDLNSETVNGTPSARP